MIAGAVVSMPRLEMTACGTFDAAKAETCTMHAGKGVLVLRGGRRIPVSYRFGSDWDDTRAGFLDCDTPEIDAGVLLDRLTVICDDGTSVVVAVTHSSDRYLAVIGRLGGP